MIKIYLIRHGQTQSNVDRLMQGWADTPLTPLGLQQGQRLGEQLRSVPFSKIYCSPSPRAYQTASLINVFQQTEIIPTKGLKEMHFGQLELKKEPEGKTWQQLLLRDWTDIGGNNVDIVAKQMHTTMDTIVHTAKDNTNILCVTHCFSILSFLSIIDQPFFEQCLNNDDKVENCRLTILQYEKGQYSIEAFNESI